MSNEMSLGAEDEGKRAGGGGARPEAVMATSAGKRCGACDGLLAGHEVCPTCGTLNTRTAAGLGFGPSQIGSIGSSVIAQRSTVAQKVAHLESGGRMALWAPAPGQRPTRPPVELKVSCGFWAAGIGINVVTTLIAIVQILQLGGSTLFRLALWAIAISVLFEALMIVALAHMFDARAWARAVLLVCGGLACVATVVQAVAVAGDPFAAQVNWWEWLSTGCFALGFVLSVVPAVNEYFRSSKRRA